MWMVGQKKLLIQQCFVILSFLIIEELMAQQIQNDEEYIEYMYPEVIDGAKWNPRLPESYSFHNLSGPMNYEGYSKSPSLIIICLIAPLLLLAFISVVASFFAFCKYLIRFCR